MSEVNPRDFMVREPEIGNGYMMPGDIKLGGGSGESTYSIRIEEKLSYTAYVVKSGHKERYAKTKEKALQIASEMLLCNGNVEIKRIELN